MTFFLGGGGGGGASDLTFFRFCFCVFQKFESVREDSQIDFPKHNVKWTLWGWEVLGVDIIELKSNFFVVIIKPLISIKNGTNIFLLT